MNEPSEGLAIAGTGGVEVMKMVRFTDLTIPEVSTAMNVKLCSPEGRFRLYTPSILIPLAIGEGSLSEVIVTKNSSPSASNESLRSKFTGLSDWKI